MASPSKVGTGEDLRAPAALLLRTSTTLYNLELNQSRRCLTALRGRIDLGQVGARSNHSPQPPPQEQPASSSPVIEAEDEDEDEGELLKPAGSSSLSGPQLDEPFEEQVQPTSMHEPLQKSNSEKDPGWGPLRNLPQKPDKSGASTRQVRMIAPDQAHRAPVSERTHTPPNRRWPCPAEPPTQADPPLLDASDSGYSTGQDQELPTSDQRKPKRLVPTRPRLQLESYADADAPFTDAPAPALYILPPHTSSNTGHSQKLQSPLDGLAGQAAEWVGTAQPPDDWDRERSGKLLTRSNCQRRKERWSHQQNKHSPRPEEIRTEYYRSDRPSATLIGASPINQNDISPSSLAVEDVSTPCSAREHLDNVSHRESISPSGVEMHPNHPGALPEPVPILDNVPNMSENPNSFRQDPNKELTKIVYYYRVWGVAPSATGAQYLMSSAHPLFVDDPSLAALYIECTPLPRRAEDYITLIAKREKIHPSRITLYLWASAKDAPRGAPMAAEVREMKKSDHIVPEEMALSTSEEYPIQVSVQLEVNGDRNLRFDTADTRLRWSVTAMTRKLGKKLPGRSRNSGGLPNLL